MPNQTDERSIGTGLLIVVACCAIVILMAFVSEFVRSLGAPEETIEAASATAHTLEINPEPGTDVYVNGRKCR